MKKQLLIAAVAATMGTAAIADVSITGSGKMNYVNTDSATESSDTNAFTNELDLNITGKHGDTTVFYNIETLTASGTGALNTKAAYMTSKVGDVDVKIGSWFSADSLLSDGSVGNGKFVASTTVGGVKIAFEDQTSGAEAVIISGDVSGVSISHKMTNDGAGTDTTDTKIGGSIADVNIDYRTINVDGANNDKESLEMSTEMNGITATYAMFDSEGTTGVQINSDGYLGNIDAFEAQGFGIKTTVAGNTVQIKSITAKLASKTAVETDYTKFVVTRALASGATFEATYTDTDNIAATADTKVLDLELLVKF
jgi:hypothetical protein